MRKHSSFVASSPIAALFSFPFALTATAACGRAQPVAPAEVVAVTAAASAALPASDTVSDMTQVCPMAVPGTRVTAADTPEGAAVTFTTSGDVEELRRRVRRMAEMHGRGGGMMGGGCPMMQMPAARISAEDVPGGARVVLVAVDPEQTETLRAVAHQHAAMMMRSGACPMMMTPPGP